MPVNTTDIFDHSGALARVGDDHKILDHFSRMFRKSNSKTLGRIGSEITARKIAKNSAFDNEVLVNQSVAHAVLIATFRRAEVDAAHKFELIKAVEKKGPKAIQTAVDTAAKAANRRDSYAKKLNLLGVSFKD